MSVVGYRFRFPCKGQRTMCAGPPCFSRERSARRRVPGPHHRGRASRRWRRAPDRRRPRRDRGEHRGRRPASCASASVNRASSHGRECHRGAAASNRRGCWSSARRRRSEARRQAPPAGARRRATKLPTGFAGRERDGTGCARSCPRRTPGSRDFKRLIRAVARARAGRLRPFPRPRRTESAR